MIRAPLLDVGRNRHAAWGCTGASNGAIPSAWVFCSSEGTLFDESTVRKVMARVMKKAGLPLHFTPHCLRHIYASLMLQRGESLAYVQRQLGHASIQLDKDHRATERFQIVLGRNAREAEPKLFFLMFNDTLRRIGDYCTVRHWIGGAGTFRWISGFEDPTCHWSRNTASPPQAPGPESNS